MCDEHFEEDLKRYTRTTLSRRQFSALSVGVGMSLLLPRTANALDVTESELDITTPDGVADCYFVHPASGAHAGVLIWPDILGLRSAFRQMGKRLAESGYSVLVVNPFYRQKRAPVVPEGASFTDEATRNTVVGLAQALNATTHVTDAKAFVAFLDRQTSVDKNRKIGTAGYCMGGPMVMRTASALPERVGAAGSKLSSDISIRVRRPSRTGPQAMASRLAVGTPASRSKFSIRRFCNGLRTSTT